jgi:uncharacterized BrkB/YihY/UPF0761 family membrane protein
MVHIACRKDIYRSLENGNSVIETFHMSTTQGQQKLLTLILKLSAQGLVLWHVNPLLGNARNTHTTNNTSVFSLCLCILRMLDGVSTEVVFSLWSVQSLYNEDPLQLRTLACRPCAGPMLGFFVSFRFWCVCRRSWRQKTFMRAVITVIIWVCGSVGLL